MADTKLTNMTQDTAPVSNLRLYTVKDPTGTPLDRQVAYDNLLKAYYQESGMMLNGKISVTVSASNITVAIKTIAGNNPSTSDPVYIRIGDSVRTITAALSVTKNAGTNWFDSGSAVFAAQECDYFVYLIWNTTPVTDIVDLGFARIPWGRVYSDFSGTTTNQSYLAFANASTPTSTDDCTVIGRFAATLSAGAGYTWSVPTFTTKNLIQYPIYETRLLNFLPNRAVSAGTVPTYTAIDTNRYYITNKLIKCHITWVNSAGGTAGAGANSLLFSLPFTASSTPYSNANSVLGFGNCYESAGTQTGIYVSYNTTTTARFQATGALANIVGNDQSSTDRRLSGTFCYEAA